VDGSDVCGVPFLTITSSPSFLEVMARTPIHPGDHLAEELKELKISAAELARQIDVAVKSSHWCIDERDKASRA